MKEGGTGLHKTIREINLVYKGLMHLWYGQVWWKNSPISPSISRKPKQDTSDPVQLTRSIHVLQNTQHTVTDRGVSRKVVLSNLKMNHFVFLLRKKDEIPSTTQTTRLYLHM